MFHSKNYLQLLQQVSEYTEFWCFLLKFSKNILLSKNLMICQAEIGSYQVIPGHGESPERRTMFGGYLFKYCCIKYQTFN